LWNKVIISQPNGRAYATVLRQSVVVVVICRRRL